MSSMKVPIPKLDKKVVFAIQAFEKGEATAAQQRLVWEYIVNDICNFHSDAFIADSERLSCYLQGRRSVALLLIDNTLIDPVSIKENNTGGRNDG